jgi:dipeptidyl aminopeptidase/acylaminoacyl peptidase
MTQPIAFADGTAPPMLLAAGEKDNIVKPRNTRRLAARIRECGGEVETIFYPDLDHGRIFLALARGARDTAPVLHDVAAFIRAH